MRNSYQLSNLPTPDAKAGNRHVQTSNMPLIFSKNFHRHQGNKPILWRCGNKECNNLISDVNRKSLPKTYCSDSCRYKMRKKK